MCDLLSECCGPYRRFVLGFCFGLAIIAAVAVIVVLLLGYGRIYHLRVAVDDASLKRFAVTSTAVSYNLTVSLAVRNPNWAMSVTYRSLEAAYLFDGHRFDSIAAISSEYVQSARRTAVFRLSTGADGANASLGNAGTQEYLKEKDKGVFDVEVDLSGEVQYQLHRTWCRLEAKCPLKLQLPTPDGGAVVFEKTTCEVLRSSQKGC
ncbi:hypothetical protein ABZP36_005028 [Zizania latifolia]